jgi:hypothetical protein
VARPVSIFDESVNNNNLDQSKSGLYENGPAVLSQNQDKSMIEVKEISKANLNTSLQ